MILKNNSNTIIQAGVLTSSETRTSLLYGLVDAYNFDTNANTATSTANHGTITGATQVAGKIGNAYSFAGTNRITIGNSVSSYDFLHQTAYYSVSLWVKLDQYNLNTNGIIMSNNGTTTVNSGFSLHYENRSTGISAYPYRTFRVNLCKGIHTKPVYFFNGPMYLVNDANWHHLVIVSYGLSNVYLYFDGVQHTVALQDVNGVGTDPASGVMTVGNLDTSPTIPLNGAIDNLLIYNRPLSQSEVSALYNGGAGIQYPFV
jgi:hypothetical protein